MKIEWKAHNENDAHLATWTADVNGVRLTISYVEDYGWVNNLTGSNFKVGWSSSLEGAMADSVASVLG